MRRVFGILAVLLLSFVGIASAQAGISVRIDIAAQRMQVTTSDGEAYNWTISSGRKGFRSPNGVYRPTRLEKNWYSRKYGGAMPYAVFFRGGYAIHGTNAVGALGRPASHGCIRLHTANAAKFFALVKKHGAGQTRIALNGAANDGLSQFAKASSRKVHPAKALAAKAVAAKVLAANVHPAKVHATKAHPAKVDLAKSQLVKASAGAKGRLAASATAHKSKLATAKAKQRAAALAHSRKAPSWGEAREQILLRPSLPANAFGYQPDELQRYYQTGPRWRSH